MIYHIHLGLFSAVLKYYGTTLFREQQFIGS